MPAMSTDELCYLSATAAIAQFSAHTLSPVELVTALIERHARVNPAINAFTYILPERAMAQAKQAETVYMQPSGTPRPLEGIPLAIKDLHAIEGERTTMASR